MGIEELSIRKIEGGIRALKNKTKKPNELNISVYFEKLKKSNEPMYEDLIEKYKAALSLNKKD